MLGLLSPTLAPLKAKLIVGAVAAIAVLLAVSAASNYFLFNAWGETKVELGQVGQQLTEAERINKANADAWAIERTAYQTRLIQAGEAKALADQTVARSIERERSLQWKLAQTAKKLEEAIRHDEEAAAWARVRVPDAVIDGMCDGARSILGEGADCGDTPADTGGDSGGAVTPVSG